MIGVKEIQDIIQDIGIDDPESAQASAKWAERLVSEMPDIDEGRLQSYVANFKNGYEQCLAAHGLR